MIIETGICTLTLTGHSESVECIVNMTINQIASGSRDHSIKICFQSGICLKSFEGHTKGIMHIEKVSFSNLGSISKYLVEV